MRSELLDGVCVGATLACSDGSSAASCGRTKLSPKFVRKIHLTLSLTMVAFFIVGFCRSLQSQHNVFDMSSACCSKGGAAADMLDSRCGSHRGGGGIQDGASDWARA